MCTGDSSNVGSQVEEALELFAEEVCIFLYFCMQQKKDNNQEVPIWNEKTQFLTDTIGTLRAGTLNNIVSYVTSDEFYSIPLFFTRI